MKKIINSEYEYMRDFISALPEGGFENGGEVLHAGRNCIKLFDVDGKKIVVKKFKVPHRFNRFMYTFFRGTKAKRAYHNATALDSLGFSTPNAIAYIDVKDGALVSTSYLVTEYTDYKPIRDLTLEEKYIQAMGINALVDFTIELHKAGVKHNDFNNTNVLYRLNEDLSFDFMLIDINRMSLGYMTRMACMNNLKRLCEDSMTIYYFSQKYAEERGWNKYYCLVLLALYRGMFENHKKTKVYFKELIRGASA